MTGLCVRCGGVAGGGSNGGAGRVSELEGQRKKETQF